MQRGLGTRRATPPLMDQEAVVGLLSVPKARLPKYLAMFGTTVLAGLCLLIVVSLASGASFVEVVFSIAMKVASVAAAAAAILISVEGVVMGGYSLLVRRAAERGRDEGRIEERRRMERWREEQVKAGFDIPPLPDADGNSPATPSKRDT